MYLSMLPSEHRNLGKEETSNKMSKEMTASLDLVQISNTYVICVSERMKNILNHKPDPKVERDRLSPSSYTTALKAF